MAETRRIEHVLKGREGIPVQSVANQLCEKQPPIVLVPKDTNPFAVTKAVGHVVEAAPLNTFDLKVVLQLTEQVPDEFDLLLRSLGSPENPTIVRAEMYPKE